MKIVSWNLHLESGKHLVGVAQVLIKANVRGRRLSP